MTKGHQRKAPTWAFWHRFDMEHPDGRLYMRRWIVLRTPWFSILLHKMVTPDWSMDLHDHPWTFVSFVLWGGYVERQPYHYAPHKHNLTQRRRRRWLSIARVKAEDFHAIEELACTPTWTLCFVGRKRKSWSFRTEDGLVPWKEHLQAHGYRVDD